VALLKSATKQFHQGLKAVQLRVNVGRSRSFDGFLLGSSFSSLSPPGAQTPSSGSLSRRQSISENAALELPMEEELLLPRVDDVPPASSVTSQTDNTSSQSHRLHNFIHKISSLGSSMGESSESSTVSGVFAHRRQKSDSASLAFARRKSNHSLDSDCGNHRGLDLHLGRIGKQRSDLTGSATETTTDDEHKHQLFYSLFGRWSAGEAEVAQSESNIEGLPKIVQKGLHTLKRRHSEKPN
jgi:hypothetical protein